MVSSTIGRGDPLAQLVQTSSERGAQISLHMKILAGYVVLAFALVAVFYVGREWDWGLKVIASAIVTLVLALLLPYLLLRVARVRVLSTAALEISRGDLSRRRRRRHCHPAHVLSFVHF